MSEYNIKKKQQELNRLNLEKQKEKIRLKKKRTRKLIVKGALLEKYFEAENLTVDETEEILKDLQVIGKNKVREHKEQKKSD